jgi:thiosulfate/3-mercaptopyruvate sulfurtransferase
MYQTLISTAELARHLDDPSFVIVDVRHDLSQPETWGRAQYERAHIPGARFAHIEHELSAPKSGTNGRHPLPSPEACAAVFGRLGIDEGKQVVAYDQGGASYGARLWWMLRRLGHGAVAVLDGGFAAWAREGQPVTTEVPTVRPTTFVVRGVMPIVDAEAVAASLPQRSLFLLDARGRERFRGDVEPIDPVGGHIPGAINRPYLENLGADGTFKSGDQLRAEFGALLADRGTESVVHYCGSGVTACLNLLAMEHIGMGGTRLYPGSWSEWCADPGRPLARGDAEPAAKP